MTLHQSSARLASCTSIEPAVVSPDRKMVFKASFASSVPGVLLHYLLRRPPPVPAYCHADVYSATQRFSTASVQSCVDSVLASHAAIYLAYPVMWPTHPGSAPMLSTNYLHHYPCQAHESYDQHHLCTNCVTTYH